MRRLAREIIAMKVDKGDDLKSLSYPCAAENNESAIKKKKERKERLISSTGRGERERETLSVRFIVETRNHLGGG